MHQLSLVNTPYRICPNRSPRSNRSPPPFFKMGERVEFLHVFDLSMEILPIFTKSVQNRSNIHNTIFSCSHLSKAKKEIHVLISIRFIILVRWWCLCQSQWTCKWLESPIQVSAHGLYAYPWRKPWLYLHAWARNDKPGCALWACVQQYTRLLRQLHSVCHDCLFLLFYKLVLLLFQVSKLSYSDDILW